MAKRKVDAEKRTFQNRWDDVYLFTDIAGKPVCLICGKSVAVMKEFNLRLHYETKHQELLNTLNMEQKLQNAEKLKKNLTSQQTFFTPVKVQNEAAVNASYIVAEKIAKSSRPYSAGEF